MFALAGLIYKYGVLWTVSLNSPKNRAFIKGDHTMGRIKTKLVKRVTEDIFSKHREHIKPSFDENKAVVQTLAKFESKKLRNIVAGYLTKLYKTRED
ncbi:30S ribosomal protein S17e [Candidatus Woesearchaeota archaeon]|nr:MAG: 30S ribosomal protein S17e [Candidatus Woesearchaeota archaeon]